uniref:Uncharacterized protein n=1 Tax=Balaenoptera musculus TaxID=9771 RepID=A0A8C0C5L5_BALMU
MLKSMKKIYLVLEMMTQSSLLILEMMIKTMMIYKLNSLFHIPSFQGDMASFSFRKLMRLLCSFAILSWHPFPK